MQNDINFSGSLSNVSFSVLDTFNRRGIWECGDGDDFLRHVDQELQNEGVAFTPSSPRWLQARNGP